MALRHQTSVLALLEWLRRHRAIKGADLKDERDDGHYVETLVVPSKTLARAYERRAKRALPRHKEGLEAHRRRLLVEVLQERLKTAPKIVDLELYGNEVTLDFAQDFDSPAALIQMPVAFYVTFKMMKKASGAKLGASGRRAASGAPGYVVRGEDGPEPGRPLWVPNPRYESTTPLMQRLAQLLRPKRPTHKVIVRTLNEEGHLTLTGRPFTEQNVDRAIVSAELLLGNDDPSVPN